ncbi:class I SAM-dependent methyltransferase [Saliterribacillus persicus]|uniref:tRNA (Cmo5U34)-methyltransferase n=1 Tax=Saliterribacillus persicus TaxID=930114 RepID=A0A368XCW3_9BACI|nr:class I SAM-dependent methyltransferase [Saliterribacillus persicus]RCW65822.1 tRNA (cmo5U34)-methyltransferase [Saliterribacillus persicus]
MKMGDWNSQNAENYSRTIPQKIPGYELLYEQMIAIIQVILKPTKILVVGAGGGQELLTLGKIFKDVKYTAVDPSRKMLNLAQARLTDISIQVDWFESELAAVPITERFEVITCHLMLHFLEEKQALVEELGKRLKPGGLCFISCIIREEKEENTLPFWQQHMKNNGIANEEIEQFGVSLDKTTYPALPSDLYKWLNDAGFVTIIPYFKSYAIVAYVAIKGESTCQKTC